MNPLFQWHLEAPGTPPTPTGYNEVVKGEAWRRTWNDAIFSPAEWEGALGTGVYSGDAYHPAFLEFVQIVRTATRTGTASRSYDSAVESSSDVAEELQGTALSSLGAWSSVTPYDGAIDALGEIESNLLVSGTTYNMIYRVTESKFIIRWAPPFSSRAKIRVELERLTLEGATQTQIDIEWNGAAGITAGGVQRCFPEHISIPVTDAMWIYDPAGERERTLEADVVKSEAIVFSTPFRHVPFPS